MYINVTNSWGKHIVFYKVIKYMQASTDYPLADYKKSLFYVKIVVGRYDWVSTAEMTFAEAASLAGQIGEKILSGTPCEWDGKTLKEIKTR